MGKTWLIVAFVLTGTRVASACRELERTPHLAKDVIRFHDRIFVVTVTELTQRQADSHRYAPPFSMKGAITAVLKGSEKIGDEILAETTSGEEAHAVCPIALETGKTYLLFLRGNAAPYKIPRYGTPYLDDHDPHFKTYRDDIKKARENGH